MAIKNYASEISIERIFAELQQTLGMHGAKQISFDYGDDGKVHGVQFVIKVNDRFIPIKLPARVEKAQTVLKKQWEDGTISHKRGKENTYGYEQAYRVAWRNILDWLLAQMALLEIGMAKMEEVFLPYMQDREGAAIPGRPRTLVTDGVSRLQTNKYNSTCWPSCHGHALPPSWLKACNPARNGGAHDHNGFYHGVVL